ncbi:MAG TPA: PQQ-binding-like beta-propeller repeat protein [Planctomycetota bacterium]|jgi:outer membrane protein assembly factor BamB
MTRPILPLSPEQQKLFSERHGTLRWAALGALVLAVVMAGTLGVNYGRASQVTLLDSKDLRALKDKLATQPKNEDLKNEIRELDLKLRKEYFLRETRAAFGGWLLLAGAAAFVLLVRFAKTYRPAPPAPSLHPERYQHMQQQAAHARLSVGVLSVLVLAGGAALALGPGRKAPGPELTIAEEPPAPWPRFRGPDGSGIAPAGNYAATWDVKSGQNILWKTDIPLPGTNSAIVWGDRVLLSGADDKTREVYCFDAAKGAIVWRQKVDAGSGGKIPKVMKDTGFASPTMACDSHRAYVIFANGDLAAFDYNGKQIWARNLGLPENPYGHAASLVTYKNLVIVPYDQHQNGKYLAVDSSTGKTVWEVSRKCEDDWLMGWATPVIISAAGRDQLITFAKPRVVSYNPADGKLLWFFFCDSGEVAPSPVFGNDKVFVAQEGMKLFAIKPDGSGEVTKTHLAWSAEDNLPDACSPITDGKNVWLLTSSGVLTCFDAATGAKKYEHDYAPDTAKKCGCPNHCDSPMCYSSPTIIGDRLMITTKETGTVFFAALGSTYKAMGRAEMGAETVTCPAFAGGRMYIRTKVMKENNHIACKLVCIGEGQGSEARVQGSGVAPSDAEPKKSEPPEQKKEVREERKETREEKRQLQEEKREIKRETQKSKREGVQE